jgi:hypothetical protein
MIFSNDPLLQLSTPAAGGATVFTKLDVAAFPSKVRLKR